MCASPVEQVPGHKKKIFCCKDCCVKWWNSHPDRVNRKAIYSFVCPTCGKEFTAYGNKGRKYCSHECYVRARFHD